MGNVVAEISMSLDGFMAGPNPTLVEPRGQGGERFNEWVFGLVAWREAHDLKGCQALWRTRIAGRPLREE
jgi:hypothetical protein